MGAIDRRDFLVSAGAIAAAAVVGGACAAPDSVAPRSVLEPSADASLAMSGAEGTTFGGTATLRSYDAAGLLRVTEYWPFFGVMLDGMGQLFSYSPPTPPDPNQSGVVLANYVRNVAPIMALASWNSSNRLYRGFSDVNIDAQGKRNTIYAAPGVSGAPTPAINSDFDNRRLASVGYNWVAMPGGHLLASQTCQMWAPSGASLGRLTVTFGYNKVAPTAAPRDRRHDDGVDAEGTCFGGVLKTVGGFVGLCTAALLMPTTGPLVPVAAVAWLASWTVWTGTLVDAAIDCSGGSGHPLRKT